MKWLKTLFTGSVHKVVDSIGEAIDKNVTNDEERLALRNDLVAIELGAQLEGDKLELQYEQELSKRHQSDMQSDDKWSKRIRPLSLAFLLGVITVLAVTDGNLVWGEAEFTINPAYVSLFQALLMTAFGFYFGGRSLEKIVKIIYAPKPTEE